MNSVPPNQQLSIFDSKCTTCQIFKACGGSTTSSPCGCFQTGEKRYDCANCKFICQDRYNDKNGSGDSFAIHNFTGRNLEDVQFEQNTLGAPLPLLIPAKTHKLPDEFQLNVKWAAVEIDRILQNMKEPSAQSTDIPEWSVLARMQARVPEDTRLLAVSNGFDRTLENFWASDRSFIYNSMAQRKYNAVTGPTFSVYGLTKDTRIIPESHRVAMLRRHHRVIQEIAENGLIPIPNIYCRNAYDIKSWIEWLSRNESIKLISRDLTCTRSVSADYEVYVNQLIKIIRGTGRVFHIIFQGVSLSKASLLLKQFSEVGCKCSFVVSDPIIKGSRGYELIFHGAKLPKVEKNKDLNWPLLAIQNVKVFNNHLVAVASQMQLYKDTVIEHSNSVILHLTKSKNKEKKMSIK